MNKIKGLSLIELLMGLFCAGILLLILMQSVLLVKKQHQQAQQKMNRLYDLQYAQYMLRHSVHHAGFTPCIGINWLTLANDVHPGKLPLAIEVEPYGMGDRLNISRMHEQFNDVVATVYPDRLIVEGQGHYSLHQPVMIADCFNAEINEISHVLTTATTTEIRLKFPLRFTYTKPAYFSRWLEESFFVQQTAKGEPALYYRNRHAEVISDEIQTLKLRLVQQNRSLMVQAELGQKGAVPVHFNSMARMA